MAEDLIHHYSVSKVKICVINNPISNLPHLKDKKLDTEITKFITVGRLTEIKGHQRLLKILSKLETPFTYTLIGDGSLKDEIFETAKQLKLTQHINHIPFTNKVDEYIAQHDIFLQGSYVEGFPNALLESCVVGTPVIAFNAPGGTKEIVENDVNGYLVDSEEEFLEKLKDTRSWNPDSIRHSVVKKFNKEKILKQYEDLFLSIVK
jgi:glycosyltransferase involved in cell wall biosynthesis